MDIYYLGHASFRIKGKTATVVTDPFDSSMVGLKFPKIEADIVTVSHAHLDHNAVSNILGSPYIVSGPGEYEIKGVSIVGVSVYHDNANGSERGKNTLYQINMDRLSLVHLGDLGHKLSPEQIKEVGACDILFIPVGGFYTIDAAIASEVAASLEPRIIIPMHYNRLGLNQSNFGALAGVDKFLKEMGKEGVTTISKLTITKDKLPEETEVVVLE